MKPKKALKILSNWKKKPIEKVEEAIEFAVRILPYSVDTKPVYAMDIFDAKETKVACYCPACEEQLDERYDYCPHCGQSLKWDD